MIDSVRRTIRRFDLATADTKVVVALSGGSDSTALTYLLRELDMAGELRLVGLAHFNHQLRASAARDEAWCRELGARLGLPILVETADVAAQARAARRSLEDAARRARHAFFDRARRHFSADVVALGHTRDDQAETYLLRLIRGAGVRGLASMHPRKEAIIRPLLDCRRADLRRLLDARELAYVHDESNDDVSIPRNRVRAELLPLLEARFNPAIVDVLARGAELARDEWQWMSGVADEYARNAIRRDGQRWLVSVKALERAPMALARLLVHRTMTEASGGATIPFGQVDRVLRLMREPRGGLDVPGHRVERHGDDLAFVSRPAGVRGRWSVAPHVPSFDYPLSIPGEVVVKESGCLVTAEVPSPTGSAASPARFDETIAAVRRDQCQALRVRNRRPGDRFRPAGSGGAKKLQDFFVDRKVARFERDAVPIVVDRADKIVWVAGHAIDDQFRVTDPAQAVLILRLKVLGGSE
jgi:tRNA(Ile)-lysidine synthase